MVNETETENFKKILLSIKKNNTQKWLAKELKVSPFAVSSWLNDGTFPTYENLQFIANYLNISFDQLMAKIKGEKLNQDFPEKAEMIFEYIKDIPKKEKIQLIKLLLDYL